MQSITIITIVVVALLTIAIFGLSYLGFNSCLRLYQIDLAQGKYDIEIRKEYKYRGHKIFGNICSVILIVFLFILVLTSAIFHKMGNENITIGNKTILVIKSGSMSDFYDDKYAASLNNDKSLQFSTSDICVFEKISNDTELIKGEVYGYKIKNIIITHRLVNINSDGTYEFRGDNNPTSDSYHINKGSILYHYTGARARGIGAFILYAQSYFGIWSIIGIIVIAFYSKIIMTKIDRLNRNRYFKDIRNGRGNENENE